MQAVRISCSGGRCFEFDVDRSALLVIDMQRDFLDPKGYLASKAEGKASVLAGIVPNVSAVLAAARRRGLMVVHTREGYSADGSDATPYKKSLGYVGAAGPNGPFLIRGAPGHDFYPGFEPRPGEPVVDKAAFSAFYGTRLDHMLERRNITHLVLSGVTTQCCVHSTLRDAVERGFFCLTLMDCCAAEDPEVHEAALRIIQAEGHLFGWIASASAFVDAVSRPPAY